MKHTIEHSGEAAAASPVTWLHKLSCVHRTFLRRLHDFLYFGWRVIPSSLQADCDSYMCERRGMERITFTYRCVVVDADEPEFETIVDDTLYFPWMPGHLVEFHRSNPRGG